MPSIASTLRVFAVFACFSNSLATALADPASNPLAPRSPVSSVFPTPGGASSNSTISSCCKLLDRTLPGKVSFPKSSEYETLEGSYYAAEQSDLRPSCRVAPASTQDVSLIVKIATQNKCEFAVKSNGHMVWKGASNVGPSGFTIDMNKFQSMSLSDDRKVVTIGTGLSWRQVFSFLLPYNLTTTGGRSSHVGVGGFLLGGGLSFLSYDQGLGSTNVLAYEIILPDASIARVTQHSNPDLYWALKYGSTNFGIVTRFEMTTFHLGEMWGGANYYPPSYGIALFQALVQFTANLAKDPKGLNAVGFFWNTTAQEYFVWSPNFYRLPTPWPAIFDPFKSFKPVMTTQRITNFVSITDEVQAAFTGGLRIEWFSRTLKADAQILWDIQTKHAQLFAQHHHRANFTSGFMAQPWNAGLIKAGASRNGGNPFGQSEANGDLILIQTSITWLNAADDGPIKSTFNELSKYIVDTAQERGLLTPFIYMNYAQGIQDIMGSIGQDNLKRMRSIRQTNDPHDYFKKYWKGGYKL